MFLKFPYILFLSFPVVIILQYDTYTYTLTPYYWWREAALHTLSSVQFSRSLVSDSLRPHESQHARPPCPSPTPGVHSNSCLSSRWCHPAISCSVVPFSSWPPRPYINMCGLRLMKGIRKSFLDKIGMRKYKTDIVPF